MEPSLQFCPRCKRDVRFEKNGRAARCPACGFQYDWSPPPLPGSLGMGAERHENPWLQFLKLAIVALLVLMGVGALVAGILFVGCTMALRGAQ